MFHQSSKQILLGIFVALLLITMPVHAVEKFKTSNFGGAHQIWFEAEDFDERIPDTDECFPVVDAAGAFGQAISRGGDGGRISWTFDISAADGKGGTWHFWGRVLNPDNRSDYMLVEGDPGDPVIPTGPPFPGGSSAPEFDDQDDRIFEATDATWDWWGNDDGSDKVLQDGQNTMYIFERQGNADVFWDVFVWTDSPDYVPTDEDYQNAQTFVPGAASKPSPAHEGTDAPRDVVLSWQPGDFAAPTNGHKIYFGESFNDVNDGIGAITQSAGSYARPQRLDFDKTYYWRVDEVDGPPNYTVHEGKVWSFTTELFAYPIENVTTTASSAHQADTGPENTINGSGLDDNDLHSVESTDMWLSGSEPNTWIEYEFDKVHKLHEMWVWNSNQIMELILGLGCKDVSIEYSVNGTDYTTLGTTHEFAQAPGADGYAHNTTVDFGGVSAKYVRLTVNNNWGGFMPQYGLSEVRFFYIPVLAREPSPDSGTTDVAIGTIDEPVDVTIGFRAGREADKHDVYFSSDEQAVIDGNVPVATVTETSYGPLSLDLGTTYYWKINEVNDAETPTTWQSDIWNFTTQKYFVVDDFEDYNDYPPDEIWSTWIDGYGVPTNGATVGYPAPDWNQDEHYVETAIVYGGQQSMPYFYDNSGTARYSEAELTLSPAQDWTGHGITVLSLQFCGDPNNAVEQMYAKLNGSKVVYDGDAADITQAWWHQWNIDLASFGVNLQNVTKLSISFGDETSTTPGGSGKVLFDDIQLYRSVPGPPAGIWIEAEAADSITSPMEIYDDSRASRGQCIGTTDDVGNSSDNPPPDGIATYTFTVEGGTYKVSCRIIIPSGDSFWVRIPGATTQTTNHSSGWVRWSDPDDSYNWYWADVFSAEDDADAVFFTMPAGTHTLEIARREDGALLDAIVISKID